MASASNVRAGGAFVELFTKDGKLVSGLNRAAARVKAFGATVSSMGSRLLMVGGLLGAPLLGAARLFSNMGDDVAKAAIRLSMTTEALSELRHAANLSGASNEELENGLKFMQRTIAESGEGLKEAADNLALLGVSFQQLQSLSPEDQIELLATRFAQLPDGMARTNAAMGVFGRAGTRLIPLLNSGAAGIQQMREEARRLGFSISGEAARSAEAFNDSLGRLTQSAKMLAFNVGGALAPSLQQVAGWLTEAGAAAGAWIKRNAGLVKIVAAAIAALTGVGIALFLLGPAISAIGVAIGLVSFGLKLVLGIGTLLITMIAGLMSPLGLVLLTLDLLRGYLVASAVNATNTFGVLREGFRGVAQTAITAWRGINDAIAAGDWVLAGRIAMTGLRLAWRQTVSTMRTIWSGFTAFFTDVWQAAVYNAARLLVGLYEAFGQVLVGITGQTFVGQSGLMPILNQMETEEQRERERRRAAAETAAAAADQAEIDRLRGQLNSQAGIAAILRAKAERPGKTMPGVTPTDLGALGTRMEARGTFSAFAVAGLGAASVTDRIATATEETARNTRNNATPAFT